MHSATFPLSLSPLTNLYSMIPVLGQNLALDFLGVSFFDVHNCVFVAHSLFFLWDLRTPKWYCALAPTLLERLDLTNFARYWCQANVVNFMKNYRTFCP